MGLIANLNNYAQSLLRDIEGWKNKIAAAINIKGGSASSDSSFSQLAEDIENLNDSFITYGVTADPKIDWLKYICNNSYDIRSGIKEISRDDIEYIEIPYAFYRCTNLSRFIMNGVKSISGSYTLASCPLLQHIELNALEEINANYIFSGSAGISEINLPSLRTLGSTDVFRNSSFGKIQADNLLNLTQGSLTACANLKEVVFPNVNSLARQIMTSTNVVNIILGTIIFCDVLQNIGSTKTRNITIGQDTDVNLYFNSWTATKVIAEGQSGIDELNENLYNNLLTKLYDHSQDGQTRTLCIGWMANVSEDNIAYATDKGWTLTT